MIKDTITEGPSSTTTGWTLTCLHHPNLGKDTWTFKKFDENNIQVFHNNDVWQDKYANGYYPTAQARTLWHELLAKGYV